MMKKRLLLLSLLSVLGISLSAQERKIEIQEFSLDNGLNVILHQDKSTPIVAIAVLYHVGSKNEKPDRTGFAHFFEHLLFEGSENIERGEFDAYIENAGGTLNAYTTSDVTCYFEILPSNQLELGLWLESERMLHAKVEQKGIDTQREVVKEEKRQRYDNQPYGTFLEQILKRAYTIHPYQWTTIGSMDHLNAATEADYIGFYKQFYVPNNATLVIAGDIDPIQAKAAVEKYFSTIPKSEQLIYRPVIKEPAMTAEIRDTILDKVQLPGVFYAYRTPAIGTEDFYAVNLLTTLLASGESSRFQKALVDEQQKAIAVGNFVFEREDPGLAIAYGIAAVGVDPKEVEAAIDAEIVKVQNELISEEDFQKLRNQTESSFINSNATVFGMANNLATYKALYGDAKLINAEIGRFMAVTREDIQRVAKKYFVPNNRVVLYYLPNTQP